jgi:hypothetical protein
MGKYLRLPKSQGKATQLVDLYGAKIVPHLLWKDIPPDKAMIVVIENSDSQMVSVMVVEERHKQTDIPAFDAAAWAFSENEYKELDDPDDPRPRTYLLMDRKVAESLTRDLAN